MDSHYEHFINLIFVQINCFSVSASNKEEDCLMYLDCCLPEHLGMEPFVAVELWVGIGDRLGLVVELGLEVDST